MIEHDASNEPADTRPANARSRTRGEIERDRAALLGRTTEQIGRIAAEFHALLPRHQASAESRLILCDSAAVERV